MPEIENGRIVRTVETLEKKRKRTQETYQNGDIIIVKG